jgi:hypothetical protein
MTARNVKSRALNHGASLVALQRGTCGGLRNVQAALNQMFGSGGGGTVAADVAALGALPATVGGLVFVTTLLCYWHKNPASTLTPDGITVVAATGGGNWERMIETSSPEWQSVATWTVNTISGDDENAGTALAPLATMAEIRRRWGQYRPLFDHDVTINVTGDVDEIVILRADVQNGATIFFNAVAPTVEVAGVTIDTAQPWSYATGANGQDAQVTSGDIVSWASYRATSGYRLRRVADDFYGWNLSIVGVDAGIGRVSVLGKQVFAPGPDGLITQPLSAGNVIDIERLQRLAGLTLDVQRTDIVGGTGAIAAVVSGWFLDDDSVPGSPYQVMGNTGVVSNTNIAPAFLFCSILSELVGSGGGISMQNCAFVGANGLSIRVASGGCGFPYFLVFRDCDVTLDGTIAANRLTFIGCRVTGGSASVGIFESNDDGLTIDIDTTAYIAQMYGADSLGVGLNVNGRCYYAAGTPPKMTGTGGDTLIGGVVVANGALPSITPANNAMVVALP